MWKAWRLCLLGGLLWPGSFDECFIDVEAVGVGFSAACFASDGDVWRFGESHCAAVYGVFVFVLGEGDVWFEFVVAAPDWLGVVCDSHGVFLSCADAPTVDRVGQACQALGAHPRWLRRL